VESVNPMVGSQNMGYLVRMNMIIIACMNCHAWLVDRIANMRQT
jgi:hypothetical protein